MSNTDSEFYLLNIIASLSESDNPNYLNLNDTRLPELKVKEITVNSHGLVKIIFNEPILMPANIPTFTPSNLISTLFISKWDETF